MDYDAQIAAIDQQLETLTAAREALFLARHNATLDAHLARLPVEVKTALRDDYPRAKNMKLLTVHGLAYSNGGSSRCWYRAASDLRRRMLDTKAAT
jgi:hypothetical protein